MASNKEEVFKRYMQLESRSVVINGKFNPAIFQPYWLASKGIIGEQEAKAAEINVISTSATQFKIGDWLEFICTPNKMQLLTRQAPYYPFLRDFALHLFELNKDIPVESFGLNFIFSISMRDNGQYYKIGREAGGLDNWDRILEIEDKCRLNNISVQLPSDDNNCIRNIEIRRTDDSLKINNGVDININCHFPVSKFLSGNGGDVASVIEKLYDTYCENSHHKAVLIFNGLMGNDE